MVSEQGFKSPIEVQTARLKLRTQRDINTCCHPVLNLVPDVDQELKITLGAFILDRAFGRFQTLGQFPVSLCAIFGFLNLNLAFPFYLVAVVDHLRLVISGQQICPRNDRRYDEYF